MSSARPQYVTYPSAFFGANSVVFSVVYGFFIRPLPVEEPQQLVRIYSPSGEQREIPVDALRDARLDADVPLRGHGSGTSRLRQDPYDE